GECARAVPWGDRGVAALAVERELKMASCKRGHRGPFAVERMRHHRGVDSLERSLVEQGDFPAAAFFGRGAEKHHPARQLLQALETRNRAQSRPRNQVMTTRVAVGQRVVLGKDRDRGAFRAELGAKGSLEV